MFRLTAIIIFSFLILCGLAVILYAVLVEPFRFRVVSYDIKTAKWPYDRPLKIALVSDIHAAWPWMTSDRVGQIVDRVHQQSPDMVLLLGDYVGTHPFKKPVTPEGVVAQLSRLTAPCGVYGIFGNHDFGAKAKGWEQAFRNSKLRMLEDDVVNIGCHENRFSLVGMKDQYKQDPRIEDIIVEPGYPTIFAMHEPDLFPEVPKNVVLTVAGHTHGGQINMPYWGPVLVPSKYGTRYAYGHIQEDGKDLIVSGGLGMSVIPARFLAAPEINIVTISRS